MAWRRAIIIRQATSRCLNQRWLVNWRIYASCSLTELNLIRIDINCEVCLQLLQGFSQYLWYDDEFYQAYLIDSTYIYIKCMAWKWMFTG